jgi:hypothetical protein
MRAVFTAAVLTLCLAAPAFAAAVITVDQSGAVLQEQAPDGTLTMTLLPLAHAEEPVLNKPLAEASPRPEPQSAADAGKLALEIFTAVKSGNWGLAAALALMLVVYAARLFLLPKMNPQAVPLVVAFLGVIGGIASALSAGAPVLSAVLMGLFVGAAASGMWEQVFKHILPEPPKPVAQQKAPDAPSA